MASSDLVHEVGDYIHRAMSGVSSDWVELCSISTLNPFLSNVLVIDKEGKLHLNLLGIAIGQPGIKKSIPIFGIVKPIVKEVGNQLNRDFLIPTRTSVEGAIKYFSEKRGEEYPYNQGIILRDEFGGLFNQIRNTEWQSDGMEFISELYDGTFQKRVTVSGGLCFYDEVYACMLTASTYQFISKMDPQFFVQGTGNRFLWAHLGIDEFNPTKEDPEDYFKESWGSERDSSIAGFSKKLVDLYRAIHRFPQWNIYVEDGEEWTTYKLRCEQEWKAKCKEDLLGWAHHPIKRYPELALKLAGIYEISSQIDRIPKMDDKLLNNFCIKKEAVSRGIRTVENNRESFNEIVRIKLMNIKRREPLSIEDEARAFMIPLISSNGGLTAKNWYSQQNVTSDNNKMCALKNFCVSKKWIKLLKYSEIDQEIRVKKGVGPNGMLFVANEK